VRVRGHAACPSSCRGRRARVAPANLGTSKSSRQTAWAARHAPATADRRVQGKTRLWSGFIHIANPAVHPRFAVKTQRVADRGVLTQTGL